MVMEKKSVYHCFFLCSHSFQWDWGGIIKTSESKVLLGLFHLQISLSVYKQQSFTLIYTKKPVPSILSRSHQNQALIDQYKAKPGKKLQTVYEHCF